MAKQTLMGLNGNEASAYATEQVNPDVVATKMRFDPMGLLNPGKVFRKETPDPTHLPMFFQVEGLMVDEGTTLGDLKGLLDEFAREEERRGVRHPRGLLGVVRDQHNRVAGLQGRQRLLAADRAVDHEIHRALDARIDQEVLARELGDRAYDGIGLLPPESG